MQISTLVEAAAELTALTGSPWSVSKLLDYCSKKRVALLCAKISIQEEDVESVTRQQPTESLWQNATGFSTYAPLKPEAVWLLRQDGSAKIKHPADGPRSWPVREILVTLEQVWVKADALQKIYASWRGEIRLQAEAQALTASAAPVVTENASDGVELVTGKRWTPEKLAELKSYREKHGTKKAAEFFGISEQFIRKKLPSEKPQPKGYSAFTYCMK